MSTENNIASTDPRYCTTCKHCLKLDEESHTRFPSLPSLRASEWWCVRPTDQRDPITGHPVCEETLCRQMRKAGAPCGLEGKLYEPWPSAPLDFREAKQIVTERFKFVEPPAGWEPVSDGSAGVLTASSSASNSAPPGTTQTA